MRGSTSLKAIPGTGKTAVLLVLIVRAISCGEKILVCAETNFAVRTIAGVYYAYLKARDICAIRSLLFQRHNLEYLSGPTQQMKMMQPDECIVDRSRLILANELAKLKDDNLLFLTNLFQVSFHQGIQIAAAITP